MNSSMHSAHDANIIHEPPHSTESKMRLNLSFTNEFYASDCPVYHFHQDDSPRIPGISAIESLTNLSGQNLFHHRAFYVGQSSFQTIVVKRQSFMIEAQ